MNKVKILEIDEENYQIYINDEFVSEINGSDYGRTGAEEEKDLIIKIMKKLNVETKIEQKF